MVLSFEILKSSSNFPLSTSTSNSCFHSNLLHRSSQLKLQLISKLSLQTINSSLSEIRAGPLTPANFMSSSSSPNNDREEESKNPNPLSVPRSLANHPASQPPSSLSYTDHHRRPVTSRLLPSNQTSSGSPNLSNQSYSSLESNVGPMRSGRITSASPPTRHQPYFATTDASPRWNPNLLPRPSTSTSISPAGSSLGILSNDSRSRTSTISSIPRGLLPPPKSHNSSLPPLQIPALPPLPSSRSRSNSLNRNAGAAQNQVTSPSEWSPSSHRTSPSNAITLPPLLPLPSGRARSVTLGRTLPPIDLEFSREGNLVGSSRDRDWRSQFEGPSPPQQFEFLRERVDRERRHTDNPNNSSRNQTSPKSYNLPFMESHSRFSQEGGRNQSQSSSSMGGGEQRRVVDNSSVSPNLSSHWDRRFMEPDPSPRQRYRTLNFGSPEWEAQGISMTLANASMSSAGFSQPSNAGGVDRRTRESHASGGMGNFSNNYNTVSPSLSDSALQSRADLPNASSSSSSNQSSSSRPINYQRSISTSIINPNQTPTNQYHQSSYDSSLLPSGLPLSQSTSSIGSSSQSSSTGVESQANPTKQKSTSSTTTKVKSKSSSSSNSNPKLVLGTTRSRRAPKSHVVSACVNCKSAHLACDVQRPCNRCVQMGKVDSCVDVQHKKRGRPRLFKQEEESSNPSSMSMSTSTPTLSSSSIQQGSSSNPVASSHYSNLDSRSSGTGLEISGIVGPINDIEAESRAGENQPSVFRSGHKK